MKFVKCVFGFLIWAFCRLFNITKPNWINCYITGLRADGLFCALHPRHQANIKKLRNTLASHFAKGTVNTIGFKTRYYAQEMSPTGKYTYPIEFPDMGEPLRVGIDIAVSCFGLGRATNIGSIMYSNWREYVLDTYGVDAMSCTRVWVFLDGPNWSDDPQKAVARFDAFINGFNPIMDSWGRFK